MKQEIITCDVCGRDINIPNEEERTATAKSLNGEIIVFPIGHHPCIYQFLVMANYIQIFKLKLIFVGTV